jgi:prepilin-type N-terminal cleavage/methylation domain-containing protein
MREIKLNQAGYTLTEMLVVIAIIGMLALVMVPNFMTFYQSNKMKASMRNLTTDLRSTRQLAISRGDEAMLTYGVGSAARSYDIWLGDRPFNSVNWTRQTGPGSNPPKQTKFLDDVVFFPSGNTLQTFTDVLDCSSNTNCAAGADTKIDVIFRPDGSAELPSGNTSAIITIQTLQNIPKPIYTVTISPSGRVLAQ